MKRLILLFFSVASVFSFAEEGLLDTLAKPGGNPAERGDPAEPAQNVPDGAETGGEYEDGYVYEEEAGEEEEFDEKKFWENYEGPDIKVIYDERSEIDYVIVQTENEYTEFHYLDHIGYSDLIFVLTDMLKRITEEGYVYASKIITEYKKNEEVALIYKIDKVGDTAYGIVQFPDFSVSVHAKKNASAEYPFNVASPNHMMALVYQFTMALAEVEQRLGVNQLEYTKKFFKQQ
jgi:hypothetical protein